MKAKLRAALAFLLSVGCGSGSVASPSGGQAGAQRADAGASPLGVGGNNASHGGATAGSNDTGGASGNVSGFAGATSAAAAGSAGMQPTDGGSTGGQTLGGAAGAPSDCTTSPAGCGSVLYVGGESPRVGVDLQLHQVLEGLKLQVEDVRETATPAQADGKRLVVLSYSMSSNDFKAEDWADVAVPMIVLEHYLLPRLGMTTEANHGYHDAVTELELVSTEPLMTAGMPKGNVAVYTKTGEFFWGVPGAEAVTIATVVGTPSQPVTFGYPAGSMMAGKVAPARRVQAFVAVHAPPPNPAEMLSESGKKLFGGCVAWAIQ